MPRQISPDAPAARFSNFSSFRVFFQVLGLVQIFIPRLFRFLLRGTNVPKFVPKRNKWSSICSELRQNHLRNKC